MEEGACWPDVSTARNQRWLEAEKTRQSSLRRQPGEQGGRGGGGNDGGGGFIYTNVIVGKGKGTNGLALC